MQRVLAALSAGCSSLSSLLSEHNGVSNSSRGDHCSSRFMTQWIDHTDHAIGTFQQQVQLVTEYFKPGGPIIVFQGAETITMTCVESTSVLGFARELNAIAASIEHRYFGDSLPLAPNLSHTPDGLRFLTLDNVMDDTVAFVEEIRANITGAANSRVIAVSASYGGLLTAALRLNRPEVIYGAIAAAPPMRTYLTADNNVTGRFDMWNWVSTAISEKSARAASAIKHAFMALENALATENVDLQRKLSLCRKPIGHNDKENILNLMRTPFHLMTQLNYAHPSSTTGWMAYPLDRLVQKVLAQAADPFKLLQSVALLWYGSLDPSITCLAVDAPDVNEPGHGIQGYPFLYIHCTYVPTCFASISNDTIFTPRDPSPSEAFSFCNSTYGVTPMPQNQLETRYHLSQADYEQSERIIFSVGQFDPMTALAPPYLQRSANIHKSKLLYVSNMAHGEEITNESPHDKPEVIQARAIELETMRGWLEVGHT